MSRFQRASNKRETLKVRYASDITFSRLVADRAVRDGGVLYKGMRILAIDPGETSGIATYVDGVVKSGQIRTSPKMLDVVFDKIKPTNVVCEEYYLYDYKAMAQSWTKIRTLRYIGMIEYICAKLGIPLVMQTAQVGKSFVTNEKLVSWGFYKSGQPHAMDAVRHLCQYILFYRGNVIYEDAEGIDLSEV